MPRFFLRWALGLALLCGGGGSAWCQKYALVLRAAPGSDVGGLQRHMAGYPQRFHTGAQLRAASWRLVLALHRAGYLAASVDTFLRSGNTLTAVVTPDLPYCWISLSLRGADSTLLARARIRPGQWSNRPLDPPQLRALTTALLRAARRRGGAPYPYWQVRSINILADGGVSGTLHLQSDHR